MLICLGQNRIHHGIYKYTINEQRDTMSRWQRTASR